MKKYTFATILAVTFIALLCGAVFFLAVALIYWVICFAFGMMFSWKIAVGVWAVIVLLRMVMSAAKPSEKK